jgi:NitT/TauT family transport system ATP-binding protein
MSSTPTTSEPGEQIGMAKVLEAVRPPAEIGLANVVEFSNVSKTYNEGTEQAFTAIRDVNFVVADLPGKGEFISVLGPSGCGKSTILRLIAGLAPQHPATLGEVLVLGKPVAGPGADRGMVFQDYTSLDHRTVLENITFGLECQGVGRSERFELGKLWIRRITLWRHAAARGHRPHTDPQAADHSDG